MIVFAASITVHALAGAAVGALWGNPVLGLSAGLAAWVADFCVFLTTERLFSTDEDE